MIKTNIILLSLCFYLQPTLAQPSANDDAQQISGNLTLGLGLLSDDSYRFGRYNGIVDQGAAPLFSLQLQTQPFWKSNDPRYAWLDVNYYGTGSVFARGEIGFVNRHKSTVEFRRLSNFLFSETTSPFLGKSNLTLPNSWQISGNTTQGFDTLNTALHSASLETQRDRWQFNFENIFLPSQLIDRGWDVNLAFRHENKKGQRALSGTIGTNPGNARAAVFTAPVDFDNNIIDLGLHKNSALYQYGIHYSGSFFTNENTDLRWQNPFGQVTPWPSGVAYPDGIGQLAREPDNLAQQLSINASWYFDHSSLHTDISRGVMTQNQHFLPFTINPNLTVTTPLPANDLDGKVYTTYVNLRYVSRLSSKLNIVTRYRLDDRDNHTPQHTFFIVAGDAENQGGIDEARINRPYSYADETLSIDGSYYLTRGLQFNIGASRDDKDRNFSEIDKTRENTIKAGLTINRWQSVNIQLNVSNSDRDSDDYVGNRPLLTTHVPGTIAATSFENHPQLRKYYLTDRQRRQWQMRVEWFPSLAASLGLNTNYNRDSYDDQFFGLQDTTLLSWTLDANYQVNNKLHISAFLSQDHYDADQAGRSFTNVPGQYLDPTRNWNVSNEDSFGYAGFTLEWRELPITFSTLPDYLHGSIDTGLEFIFSRSQSDINSSTGPALTVTPLPDIKTRLRSYRWYWRWHLPNATKMEFVLTHEHYRSDDFGFNGVGPTTIANVLTLGELNPNYSLNWITFSYSLPF